MATLFGLAAIVISGLVAWFVGGLFTSFGSAFGYGWAAYPWAAPAALFLLAYLAVTSLSAGLLAVLALNGGGIWAAAPVRWVIGKLVFLVLLAVNMAIIVTCLGEFGFGLSWFLTMVVHPIYFMVPLIGGPPGLEGTPFLVQNVAIPTLRWGVFSGSFMAAGQWQRYEHKILAWATLPVRRLWQAVKEGVGGSSAFDGLMDEWLMPWKRGQVILGTSLYEPSQRLGKADDRHLLTVATTRSGKGRACIIPNLLTYPGSALVIDPKGENAAVTAQARRAMGQTVYILDPFGKLADPRLKLSPAEFPVQRFNPLAAVNVNAIDVVEQIGNIADALIVHSAHGNPFWDNAAKAVLVGIIAHVLTWPKLADDERNLGTVRDYVSETNGRSLDDLEGSHGAGNLAAIARSELKRSSDGAGGDIATTLATHVKWLDSLAMREALKVSDFDLESLKTSDATLYLIIPSELLEEHARFLRLFITLAMKAVGRGVKSKHPMLFILDEFATLGPLKAVEQAAGLLAGGGVRIWPIIQNLTQLRMYGENWEVFVANAGQVQLFAVNDQSTAKYFSEKLGNHMAWRKVKTPGGAEWVPQGSTWLRTVVELARMSSRDSGRALIFYEGGRHGIVRRPNYDRVFGQREYAPNPYERGRETQWSKLRDLGRIIWDEGIDGFFDRLFVFLEEYFHNRAKRKAAALASQGPPAPEPVAAMAPTTGPSLHVPEVDPAPAPMITPIDPEVFTFPEADAPDLPANGTVFPPSPIPKKRGRPRKNPAPSLDTGGPERRP